MLKGKAKEDFEKWVYKNVKHYITKKPKFGVNTMEFEFNSEFYILPFSMQYGVLVDWFDSVGIHIHINMDEYGFDMGETIHECSVMINFSCFGEELTRPQARQKAIEQAMDHYNNK